RNHAKTARVIAAFGDLYVSEVSGRKPEARCVVIRDVSWPRLRKRKIDMVVVGISGQNFFDDFSKLIYLIQPNECVHLRHLLTQLFGKSLRHAAAYDQFL